MPGETAFMQSGLTVREAARLMNVSERSVYMARAVQRLRPDLADRLDAGTLSLSAAYREVTGKSKESARDRLVRAWDNATDDDRVWLLAQARDHAE